MKLDGIIAVVSTIQTKCVPPNDAAVCIVKNFDAAKKYIKEIYTETLEWDMDYYGKQNVSAKHDDNWRYAEIVVKSPEIVRKYYISTNVNDPR